MSMSDIMSTFGLAVFPIVGMLLFLSVFVGVVMRVLSRGHALELDRAAFLPLHDQPSASAGESDPAEPRSDCCPMRSVDGVQAVSLGARLESTR